ncbi:MAG: 2-oxoacid:acceptor oxidoreductase family protein [Oscillospiraceae bacterium]
MIDYKMLFAGFGGQGILFVGKVAVYAGLCDGYEVSWLPSYGPEMRGGTANCSVCISDEMISSPLVVNPGIFVAMNQPSYEKFINDVTPGGYVFVDSTLINVTDPRKDVKLFEIPATKLAEENDLKGLANIIMLGKLYKETNYCRFDGLKAGVEHCIPPRKQHLLEPNMKAIEIGMNY